MTQSEQFKVDASQSIQELKKLSDGFTTLTKRVASFRDATRRLEQRTESVKNRLGELRDAIEKAAATHQTTAKKIIETVDQYKHASGSAGDLSERLHALTETVGRLRRELLTHNKQVRTSATYLHEYLRSKEKIKVAEELATAAVTGNWKALSNEARLYLQATEASRRLSEANRHQNDDLVKQAELRRRNTAAIQKQQQVSRLRYAARTGDLSRLTPEDRTLLREMTATHKYNAARKELAQTLENGARVSKKNAAAHELFNAVINHSIRAVSREAAALRDSAIAAGAASRARKRIIDAAFRQYDAQQRALKQQHKNRISEELYALATNKSGIAISRETRQIEKNIRAQILHRNAVEILRAKMQGKNVVLDAQGRLLRKDSAAMTEATFRMQVLERLVGRLRNVFVNFVGYGGLFLLFRRIRESVGDAHQWAKAISEIRTISDRTAVSTRAWRIELSALSSAYGIPFVDAAEAAYNALSDQITEAADTFSYLRTQMNLALVAVSSLDAATKVTSATINAFGMQQQDASRINAIYFASVDYGRFRLEEIADTIGRVAILSDQLGVSFLEQQAALTLLTRKGIPAHEGMTLLRNVMQKLVRPTEALQNWLNELGFSSGATAIRALGLVGVLSRLAEHAQSTGDSAAELAELMGRMRAIIGAAGLTTGEYTEEVKKFDDANQKAFEALIERLDSAEHIANIATQTFKNFFANTFGQIILEAIARYVRKGGELNQLFITLVKSVLKVTSVLLTYGATMRISNGVATMLTATQFRLAHGMQTAAETTNLSRLALLKYNLIAAGTAVALQLLISQFIDFGLKGIEATLRIEAAVNDLSASLDKVNQIELARAQINIDDAANAMEKRIYDFSRAYHLAISSIQRSNNDLAKDTQIKWDSVGKILKKTTGEISRDLEKVLRDQEKLVDKLTSQITDAQQKLPLRQRQLEFDKIILEVTTTLQPENQIKKFKEELAKLQAEAKTALDNDDLELYELLNRLQDTLLDKSVSVLTEMKRESDQMAQQIGQIVPNQSAIEAAILNLEKQRNQFIQDRINLETQYTKKLEQQRDVLDQQAQQRRAQLEEFQETLSELDAFERGTTPEALAEFRKLLQTLQQQGANLQIDPAQMTALMRDLKLRERQLERGVVQVQIDARIKELSATIDTLTETFNRASGDVTAARTDQHTFVRDQLVKNMAIFAARISENLEQAAQRTWAGFMATKYVSGKGFVMPESEQLVQTQFQNFARQFRQDQQTLTQILAKDTGEIDPQNLQVVGTIFDRMSKMLAAIETTAPAPSLKGLTRDPLTSSFTLGGGETTSTMRLQLENLRDETLRLQERRQAAEENTKILEQLLNTARDVQSRFDPAWKNLPKIEPIQVDRLENVQEIERFLREFPTHLQNLQRDANLNTAVTVGDIHVQLPLGTTQQQVQTFADTLHRALRQGLIDVSRFTGTPGPNIRG